MYTQLWERGFGSIKGMKDAYTAVVVVTEARATTADTAVAAVAAVAAGSSADCDNIGATVGLMKTAAGELEGAE